MKSCSRCGSTSYVKAGKIWDKQRYKCKACNYQFTRFSKKGRPLEQKALAVFLYCHSLSFNAIGRIFGVHASSVQRWVEDFANKHCKKPEPTKQVSIIIEVDEMWHYVKKKLKNSGYGKQLILMEIDSLTGNAEIVVLRTCLKSFYAVFLR